MGGQRRQERRLERQVGKGPDHSELGSCLELIVGEEEPLEGLGQRMVQETVCS